MPRLETFLTGVKVLDLSQYIPGPMASQILADMGADVLKIEPPQGDEMRNLGPRDKAGRPVFYNALNAGKALCRMDLKQPAVREDFLALAADADVLLEGFRPGVMARLGIDFAKLNAINPRLIYCSLSGYGTTGELAASAAHDGNYLATSGIMGRNGDAMPMFFDPPISDTTGALYAAIAILGALNQRHATGIGCQIDIGLADVLMPIQMLQVADWGANGTVPKPRSTYLNGGAAYYQVYLTADGRHVMLGCVEPKFWRNFCAAAQRPDLEPRQTEALPQTTLIADVAVLFQRLTLDEAQQRFGHADCCFSPVLDLDEAMSTTQLKSRGLVRPEGSTGDMQALFPALINCRLPCSRPPLAETTTAAGLHAPAARLRKTSTQ